MSEDTIGSAFDKVDRLPFWMQYVDKFLQNLKIKPTIRLPPDKELAAAFAKANGKKAQIYVNLDGSLLYLEIRVPGTKPFRIGAKDLDSLHDNDKQRAVLDKLADSTKLTTRADVEKWHNTHYSDAELQTFRDTIAEMESSMSSLQTQYDALKAFKFDGKDQAALVNALHAFTKPRSREHYLKFVENIDAGVAPKVIFDTYIAAGAALPVNLPPAMAAPIAKAVGAGSKPDFSAARKLIVGVIDAKLIVDYRKDTLPPIEKELNRLKRELPQNKVDYKKAGGKP